MTDIGYVKILLLLGNISPLDKSGDGGSISAGTSYTLFLKRTYKRTLGIMCGRLGEMLLGLALLMAELLALPERGQAVPVRCRHRYI